MKKRLLSIILLTAILLPSLFSCSSMQKHVTESFDCFDTYSSLTVYCTSDEFELYKNEFHTLTKTYHELFDIYNSYDGVTNLKDLNEKASSSPITVSSELFKALTLAKELYSVTNGKCNVAIGAISSLWHDARTFSLKNPSSAYIPTQTQIDEKLSHTDINALVLNAEAHTVFYKDAMMKIDFGAIAKGYVASLLYDKLIALGCESFLINLGGNIVAHGNKPGSEPYLSKIKNPFEDKSLGYNDTIALNDETLVTSGSYQRYFSVDDKIYSHIIDVESGYPSSRFTSVSVLTDATRSALADALSTALFCMSYEDGLTLVESLDGVSALWIFNDGNTKISSNFGGAE